MMYRKKRSKAEKEKFVLQLQTVNLRSGIIDSLFLVNRNLSDVSRLNVSCHGID